MKKLAIKVLIMVTLMFSIFDGLNAQFLNGYYNGAMPYQLPLGPLTNPFRGNTKPNTTEWNGNEPSDSTAYFPILIVFVQFADDPEYSPHDSWPKGQGPIYMDSMVATIKNLNENTPWWEKYNPNTEMISSQWMEISRGKFHVISPGVNGKGAFSVVLDNARAYTTEQQLNQAIWMKLYEQGLEDWKPYDQWTLNQNGLFYNRGDSIVDCIYKIHRSRGRGPMNPDYDGFNTLAWSGSDWLVDTVNNIKASNSYSGFTVCFRGLKSQYIATCGHEHGHHTLMGGHVQNSRVSYGIGLDFFFSPYDMILSGYITPRTATFGATNTLGDFSSRTNNTEGEIIKIPIDNSNGRDECFLLSNRRKVSRWDRVMMGDSAQIEPYDDYSELGKGLYIYHVKDSICFPRTMNDETQDMECADGYWKWKLVSTEGIAKLPFDCFTSGTDWKVFEKDSVLYSNDSARLGAYRPDGRSNYGNPLPNGDDLSFFHRLNDETWTNRWTTGKFTNQNCGLNIERTFTNDRDLVDNGNLAGDRYDAWKPGYNEVFSPYSSPSTKTWNNQESGIFIWYHSTNGNTANIDIYKVGEGGYYTEDNILAVTPPSRPMGIKTSYEFVPNTTICHPKITWNHNQEPDMIDDNGNLKYKIYRALSDNMTQVPINYYLKAVVEINKNSPAEYVDEQIIGIESELGDDGEYEPFPLRYKVVAVDVTDDESVPSDFTDATGLKPEGSSIDPGNNDNLVNSNLPKDFSLSQNYPNPFNPTTKINFALPKQGFVSLKIYDILGREVKTLVNEVKQAGYYSVDFNGSSLSSGVYFYRIQAGDYIAVKRMVLIK